MSALYLYRFWCRLMKNTIPHSYFYLLIYYFKNVPKTRLKVVEERFNWIWGSDSVT